MEQEPSCSSSQWAVWGLGRSELATTGTESLKCWRANEKAERETQSAKRLRQFLLSRLVSYC